MTFSRRWLRALPLVLPALLAASPALAQRSAQDIASARQLYNDGIELRDKGDQKGALEKFKAAHALGNTPLTGIELCKMHVTLKQPVEAREACLSVGRINPMAEESQRSKDARVEAAKIAESEKPKISFMRVKVTGVPAGWTATVSIDGVAIPAAAMNESRPVNPGAHAVVAKVGTGEETKASVDTKEGETKDVELAVKPPPTDEKPPPNPNPNGNGTPPPPEKKSSAPTIAFGLAGFAATIGAVGGLLAIAKESELSDKCTNKKCGPSEYDTLSSASTWGTVSTVSFVLAGVLAGAGAVLMLTSPAPSKTGVRVMPVIGVGGAGLHGSF